MAGLVWMESTHTVAGARTISWVLIARRLSGLATSGHVLMVGLATTMRHIHH